MSKRTERAVVRAATVVGSQYWLCRPEPQGWRCGRCLRGNVGIGAHLLKQCRVCKRQIVDLNAAHARATARRKPQARRKPR